MSQRDDLLDAARRLLVEKGYDRTTARDLAAAAGSHLGSIGYHFGSKDALMTEATLLAQGAWGSMVDQALAAANAASPGRRIEICIDTLAAAVKEQRGILVASAQAMTKTAFDDELHRTLAEVHADARTDFAALALGTPRDQIDDHTARTLGSTVHALIVGFSMQLLIDEDSVPSGSEVAQAIRTLAGC
ncbi:TetR/AcrR family transcriptional regulator [Microlunatus parietis]|uniref:AcrR family transcriptional regulator n=1 Tax=Microlunatus parietis TaxID=682979 RepID=A0A7Y9I4D8_9ACTN|nr:TetR/AcrR family transcriptional regulator [Microlunatus parietis]NYE70057.1 AcrR family transcriptional regulator [Microlunatus parietis]